MKYSLLKSVHLSQGKILEQHQDQDAQTEETEVREFDGKEELDFSITGVLPPQLPQCSGAVMNVFSRAAHLRLSPKVHVSED